jgi:polyisoprenoid-binding protein YceI
METRNFKIAGTRSDVRWIGRKVTGAHHGTVAIKEGTIVFQNGSLAGGNVIIDTTSIDILDITDPATNAQFAGHLASDDFFSIDKFPTASLEVTSVTRKNASTYHVEGNLTIKGITRPIAFGLEANAQGDLVHATGKIVIDRTHYNMKFRSGNFFKDLGDTLIYNDFELNVNITAKAA